MLAAFAAGCARIQDGSPGAPAAPASTAAAASATATSAAPTPAAAISAAGASPSPATAAANEACAGESSVDVLHQAIDLSLGLEPPSLSGRGELRLRTRRATALITLDARELRVSEVATAVGPLPFQRVGDRLCASLPERLAEGTEIRVRLGWEASTAGNTPQFSHDHVWAGYQTSAWMPTVQDPAQRATLALRITASATLKVAASGQKTGQVPGGDGLLVHSFVLDRPSPPFLYGFAAGHFSEAELTVDGVKLRALGPVGSDLKKALAITAPMYRFLASHAGTALPSPEYMQVFVPGDAAQEAAGLSFLSVDALADLREDPTEDWIFSHELAHQWFGWLVPCADFADFWLNEGFATFLVAAVKEQRWGPAAYEREIGLWRARSAKVHGEGHDAPLSLSGPSTARRVSPSESELQPRGVTYARGALVLHKLRAELGEAAFWDGIRRYVKSRGGKGARSEDLRAALEATSGRDLRDFFARFVYAPAPDL